MYSALMSDCAERAVSDDCDGAATAAAGSAADTVTVSLMLATLSWIDTVVAAPRSTWMPVRRTASKPGTRTSTRVGARRQVRRGKPSADHRSSW